MIPITWYHHVQRQPMRLASAVTVRTSILLFLVVLGSTAQSARGSVHHVKWDATGSNNGTTWSDAFTSLQSALSVALAGDEIWVAAGTYKPTLRTNPLDPRSATFTLVSGVGVFGGFAGMETSLSQRDFRTNVTILSGDLNGDDGPNFQNSSENTYHVLTGNSLGSDTTLDGFRVSGGSATGPDEFAAGGGARFDTASLVVSNCLFISNSASYGGGGLYNHQGSPLIANCRFIGNYVSAGKGGGASFNADASKLVSCTFSGNRCSGNNWTYSSGGGAIHFNNSQVAVTNCTFAGNDWPNGYAGGTIYFNYSSGTACNCIFYKGSAYAATCPGMLGALFSNITIAYSCLCSQSGNETGGILWGSGNVFADPQLTNYAGADGESGTIDDDLRLSPTSVCIDAGNNDVDTDPNTPGNQPLPALDVDGNPRFIEDPKSPNVGAGIAPLVDIGAYEASANHFVIALPETMLVNEGGFASLSVTLAWKPSDLVTINVTRNTGDPDITVATGQVLAFDPTNFTNPQSVVLAAAEDSDGSLGSATIQFTCNGFPSSSIVAYEIDNDIDSQVLYVRASAPPGGDGLSWTTAFRELQDALDVAGIYKGLVKQIWVAAGVYRPAGPGGARTASFSLLPNLTLLGGFSGSEVSAAQRDPRANPTILSGDLNANDGITWNAYTGWNAIGYNDNSFHVIRVAPGTTNAQVDGFVITSGNASGLGEDAHGGGVLIQSTASAFLVNCSFWLNMAYLGAGLAARPDSVNPITVSNCTFYGNQSSNHGAGAIALSRHLVLENCVFSGNSALNSGGAVGALEGSELDAINCTFSKNVSWRYPVGGTYSELNGGGIAVDASRARITNSIIWNNHSRQLLTADVNIGNTSQVVIEHCDIERLSAGIAMDANCTLTWGSGNINGSPLFVQQEGLGSTTEALNDDLRLLPGSPCIDSGDNSAVLLGVDADLNLRRFDDPGTVDTGVGTAPLVDIGAYEHGAGPVPSRLYVRSGAAGTQTGTAWPDAYPDLQFAINTALAAGGRVGELWVSGGTYKPAGSNGDRTIAFRMLSGLAMHGGFAGTESVLAERDLNNPANASILSGDLNGNDGPNSTNRSDNSFHVISSVGTDLTAVLDGFRVMGGSATGSSPEDSGGGIFLGSGRPTLSHVTLVDNGAGQGGGMWGNGARPQIVDVTIDANNSTLGSSGLLSQSVADLQGVLRLTGGTLQTPQVLEVQSSHFSGLGGLVLDSNTVFHVSLAPSYDPAIIQTLVSGTGKILIDAGQQLTVQSGAVVDLSGEPITSGSCALGCPTSDPTTWGRITVNGTLLVQDATVRNSNVDVKLANLQGMTSIINNDIRLLNSSAGFGGQFFVAGSSTIQCNKITSDGDRYLDLDPDPSIPPAQRPTICNNTISVVIKQGVNLDQGELLELRSPDMDNALGGGLSGAYQLGASAGYADTWTLEKLTIEPNAKVNLTNRQGFVFQDPQITTAEALYVKQVVMHPGSVLNTGLQRLYYQTIMDENGVALAPNPQDPTDYGNGRRIVDHPLLGFSLKIIAMDDDTEFAVRIQTRLRDPADEQPATPPFKEGSITRITSDPDNPPTPIPAGAGGVMDLRTRATGSLSASTIAAKGAFARAGEEQITVAFKYKFVRNPTAELVVFLSDSSDVGQNSVELARVLPPVAGAPGSIESSEFANFSGRFPKGPLNFTRGTYVELKLIGADSRVWIDDWDPVVCLWAACGDFNDEQGAYVVDNKDYLYLLSEYGAGAFTSPDGLQSNACVDALSGASGGDGYVDLGDLLNLASRLHSNLVQSLCGDVPASASSTHPVTLPGSKLVIAGKPSTPIGQRTTAPQDALYPIDISTQVSGAGIPPAVAPGFQNRVTGNGRTCADALGVIHQLHGTVGLVRLSDGQTVATPHEFSNTLGASMIRVGVHANGGMPLEDAAFHPTDPNIVYVVPVQVIPTPGACPYRAAAKLQLTGGGNFTVQQLYGKNPAIGSTVVPGPLGGCDILYTPDASKLREIEVDTQGNVFITSARDNDNNDDYILIYQESAGNASEKRVSLRGQLAAPSALLVAGNMLYVSTSVDGSDGPTSTKVHRFAIGTNPTLNGIAYAGAVSIANMRFVTGLAMNPATNGLCAVGFVSQTCSTQECYLNPNCGAGCAFCLPGHPGCQIFTTPTLAIIDNPQSATTATANTIMGSDLALPISALFTSCRLNGDVNCDGAGNMSDVAAFVQALLDPTAYLSQHPNCPITTVDINNSGTADGEDIQAFVNALLCR